MFSHMQAGAIAGDGAFNRRRKPRKSVLVLADFRKAGRTAFRVRVIDLSQSGCHCDCTSKVTVGDRVWLSLEGFAPIEAVIRWSNPHGFGAEWAHPMHISVFEHICRTYPSLK
jgi:hypothetical protein